VYYDTQAYLKQREIAEIGPIRSHGSCGDKIPSENSRRIGNRCVWNLSVLFSYLGGSSTTAGMAIAKR
jgi:hypothetical protein